MNVKYWKRRALLVEQRVHENATEAVKELSEAYDKSLAQVRQDIESWYARLADNNDLTLAEAKKLLKADELREFHWTVEEYIKKGETLEYSQEWAKALENASAKVHITRLQALETQLIQHGEEIYAKQRKLVPDLLREQAKDSYLGTAYEYGKLTGKIQVDFSKLSGEGLDQIALRPWAADGTTFSSAIWKNQQVLNHDLQQELARIAVRGEGIDEAIDRIAKKYQVDRWKAARLIHTESAVASARANFEIYKDNGVEEFEVLETLDMTTCELCGDMDGKRFSLKDYEVGITVPPFHPNCRGTTTPWIDEDELREIDAFFGFNDEPLPKSERAARDLETNKTVYVPDMSYGEWKKSVVKDIGQKEWDIRKKMSSNRMADFDQYEKYKRILGTEIHDFELFQRTKYSDETKWRAWKDHFFVKERLSDGRYGKIINTQTQAPHMESTRKPGKSFFYKFVNVQELFNLFAGTGKLVKMRGGLAATEYVDLPKGMDIGLDIYENKIANGIAIKHSKKRTHIYPVYFDHGN